MIFYLECFQETTVPVPYFIKIDISAVGSVYCTNSFSFVVDGCIEVVRRSMLMNIIPFLYFSESDIAFEFIFRISEGNSINSLTS